MDGGNADCGIGNIRPGGNSGSITRQQAQQYCRRLARSHYENFTVASWLVQRPLRQHLANIYAYCRWADDLADEVDDPIESRRLLDWWQQQLEASYTAGGEKTSNPAEPDSEDSKQAADTPSHPVFVALKDTISQFDIPRQPWLDLLIAFRQDQEQGRYESVGDLLHYCRHSANPVGRLVLALGHVNDQPSQQYSDCICTGLQWINFCQDVARDWERGRVYLPAASRRAHGYTDSMLAERRENDAFRAWIAQEVTRAEELLQSGWPLVPPHATQPANRRGVVHPRRAPRGAGNSRDRPQRLEPATDGLSVGQDQTGIEGQVLPTPREITALNWVDSVELGG